MDQLFSALCSLVPGSQVLDVRFLVNQPEVADQDVSALDYALAECLRNRIPDDIASLG